MLQWDDDDEWNASYNERGQHLDVSAIEPSTLVKNYHLSQFVVQNQYLIDLEILMMMNLIYCL